MNVALAVGARSWRLRLAVMTVFFGNGMGFGTLAGNIPRLREATHLSDARLGATLLAVSLGAVVAMPATGRLAPRAGASLLCLVGGLALACALPAAGLAASGAPWAVLLLAMTAIGLSSGVMDVAMNARASELEVGWGLPIMSSFHAAWSFGGLAGSALAAVLVAHRVALAPALAVGGLVAGIAALAAMGATSEAAAAPVAPARWLRPGRVLAALCAIAAICFTMEGAVADWLGVYLRSALAASQPVASGAYSAFAGAMLVGRLSGDMAVRRVGPGRALQFGGALAAAGIAAGLVARSPLLAAGGFAAAGLGLANIVPVMFSAAGRRGGAAGIAMASTTGYAGLLSGPPVIGFLAQASNVGAALLLLLVGALALVALAPAVTPRDART